MLRSKSGNQIAREGTRPTSLAAGAVSKAAGWPPKAPSTSKPSLSFQQVMTYDQVLGNSIHGHLQKSNPFPLGKLPSLALSWNNGQKMLEVGDVGKKEQMSWEEIPLRNNASTHIRKERQSCKTVYTLEPECSRVLHTNLHNQMVYLSAMEHFSSFLITWILLPSIYVFNKYFLSFLYVLVTMPSSELWFYELCPHLQWQRVKTKQIISLVSL